ncbi:hypothetical protein BH10ACT9_BH10ACT9_40820 [soil metagenome]
MRPIFLGCAAVAMFIGGVMMAPLSSDIASTICPARSVVNAERPATDSCVAATSDPTLLGT